MSVPGCRVKCIFYHSCKKGGGKKWWSGAAARVPAGLWSPDHSAPWETSGSPGARADVLPTFRLACPYLTSPYSFPAPSSPCLLGGACSFLSSVTALPSPSSLANSLVFRLLWRCPKSGPLIADLLQGFGHRLWILEVIPESRESETRKEGRIV